MGLTRILSFGRPPSTNFRRENSVSVKNRVTVDECAACGGVWLDPGELRAVRDAFSSEEERARAAERYFDDLFGGELKRLQAASQAEVARARKFARTFRFICPSYYIPGKQEWGAF